MSSPVVLATNDDGIEAPGLRALVKALAAEGAKVYVAAPLRPQSGTGKALLFPARYGRATLPGASGAWWVDSTPAAAVMAGLKVLLPERPSVVVSGVNRGPNMGVEDLFTSGTIGAAVEAALHGVPGLAVSLATDEGRLESEYATAARIAARLAKLLASEPPLGWRLLIVNVPEGRPRGVRVGKLAWNNYRIRVVARDGKLAPEPHSYRARYWDSRPGTDVEAVLAGYASITPVCLERLSEPPEAGIEWASKAAAQAEQVLGLASGV